MTKKNVLIGSGFMSIAILILNQIGTFQLCGGKEYGNCMETIYNLLILFLPFFPLFLFSLITYRMKEEVFQIWWKFSRIAIPASMILIFLAPSYSYDFMFPIEKGSVAFVTSLLFVIVSIIILIRAYKKSK